LYSISTAPPHWILSLGTSHIQPSSVQSSNISTSNAHSVHTSTSPCSAHFNLTPIPHRFHFKTLKDCAILPSDLIWCEWRWL